MHKFLLFLLSISVVYSSKAQTSPYKDTTTLTIKGIIVDSVNQIPLGYVTIMAQGTDKVKSSRGILTQENGSFYITDLPNQQYRLTLSCVGYKTETIQILTSTSSTIDLGVITLVPTATQLEEIQVTTQRPLIVQDVDKLIYIVEADPESNILNTFDMLRKVPLLTVDAEDNLQLNGSSSYQILVNGKRSSLFSGNPSDVLKNLPASSIKKVEVITSPSAKYEAAEVGGIINIITHKSSISGYNGSVNVGANSPEGYTGNAYMSVTTAKLNITGRGSTQSTNNPDRSSYFIREDRIRQNRLVQTSESNSHSEGLNISGELNYELSPLDLITASYSMNRSNSTFESVQRVEQLNAITELTTAYLNLNNGTSKGNGYDASLDYQHSFKSNEQQLLALTFNLINSAFRNSSDFILQPLLNYTGRESLTSNNDGTREYNIQADYVQPIGKQLLELGARSVLEENKSNYFYMNRDLETGTFIVDPEQSNAFNYSQEIHAAYISLNLSKGKWGLRTSMRLEETRLKADFKSSGTKAKQKYRNLFPNITLSRRLKDNNILRLSYSQRIQRPSLYYLDPYVDLTDPLNISYGNPDLDPAVSHAFQLKYSTFIKNTSINAIASHNFTNNSIQSFTVLGEDSVAHTTFGNTGKDQNYGFSLSSNTTFFRKLSINLSGSTNYIKYTNIIEGNLQSNEGFSYSTRGSATLRLGKSWRISGNSSYNSSNVLLQGRSSGYTWSSLSLNKEFLKDNKASLSLAVQSPFREHRLIRHELNTPTFYQLRESTSVLRQFSLAVNYRFGKLR